MRPDFVLLISLLYQNVVVLDRVLVFLLRLGQLLLIRLELEDSSDERLDLVDGNSAAVLMPHVLELQLLDQVEVDLAGLVLDDWVLILLTLIVLVVALDEQVAFIAVLGAL